MPKTETAEVVFRHHWRDRRNADPKKHRDVLPGARETLPIEDARRLVRGHLAVFATKADAGTAGEPAAETASSSANPVTTSATKATGAAKKAPAKKAARS